MKKLTIENLARTLIGKTAKADHPITCLNPNETFTIIEVRTEADHISVRGENTCWFGQNLVSVEFE